MCCEDGVRHRGMTNAARNSSDTSPELFGVFLMYFIRVRLVDFLVWGPWHCNNPIGFWGCYTAIAQLQLQIAAKKDIPADIESPRYTSATSNNVTGSCTKTTTLREGRNVLMMSMIDMKKIVAKGVLFSVDPKSVVGGYELGDAWYEVHVKVPVVHKEHLIRPHYPMVTIHDALGASVAWPTHLVIPDLEDW
ncbi:hypothetical protein OROMI_006891 [Orobanche minor]